MVPVSNARYALNAANARWGSLYDALYGTDAIPEDGGAERGRGFNKKRGERVVAHAKEVPRRGRAAAAGPLRGRDLLRGRERRLAVGLRMGGPTGLKNPPVCRLSGRRGNPSAILLRNNDLHIEIKIDRENPIGRDDPAGVADLIIESAVSTIMDLEDSVAAVDADDKVEVYRNWLGLMNGTLSASFEKAGRHGRAPPQPRPGLHGPDGGELRLHGRSLMLVRNVGHHMYTDAVLDEQGSEIPEGMLDAAVTALIAMHDLKGGSNTATAAPARSISSSPRCTGRTRSRMRTRFSAASRTCSGCRATRSRWASWTRSGAPPPTCKAAIRAAADRVVFINTGFLDRTGDEIHTSIEAGPMLRKNEMKARPGSRLTRTTTSISASPAACPARRRSARACGPPRMRWPTCWPRRSRTRRRGRTPPGSPPHRRDASRAALSSGGRLRASGGTARAQGRELADILTIPVSQAELAAGRHAPGTRKQLPGHSGLRGALDRPGRRCSKVPDIHDVGLMEDRATLRISSQHIANWLLQGVVTRGAGDGDAEAHGAGCRPAERGRSALPADDGHFDAPAFQAACDLIFKGRVQPNGYTEFILHERRREAKAAGAPTEPERAGPITDKQPASVTQSS